MKNFCLIFLTTILCNALIAQTSNFEGKWVAEPIKEGQINFITIFGNDKIDISLTNNPEFRYPASLSKDSIQLNFALNDSKMYLKKNSKSDGLTLYSGNNVKLIDFKRDGASRISDYNIFKTLNDNSVPQLNINVDKSSKALLVLPHADDEIAFSGLIRYLIDKGVTVHYLLLCHNSKEKKNKKRISEVKCSSKKLGIEEIEIIGLPNNSWENVLSNNISFWYDNKDSIRNIIKNKIEDFNPSILITWDDIIGAYGHPEHRITAELTKELFFDSEFDRIFQKGHLIQFALPSRINNFMFIGTEPYEYSKKIVGEKSLPKPNYSINITEYWDYKYNAAKCHKSQKQVMYNYYLLYDRKEKNEHIKAFNKEYYFVISK